MDTVGLHVTVAGSGTPMIFLHGYAVDHRTFLPCEDVFTADSPWQRIYVDLPGFGASPPDGIAPTADAIADKVEDFVARNFPSRFAVVGNSFGAQLARRLVGLHADRVLGAAFISPVVAALAEATLPARPFIKANKALRDRVDPVDRALFRANAVDQSWDSWRRFERSVLPGLKLYDHEFGEQLRTSFVPTEPPADEKNGFDGPALLVTGRNDTIVGWSDQQRLLELYPRMESVVLDSCGHNPHVDRPELFELSFREWVRRVTVELSAGDR